MTAGKGLDQEPERLLEYLGIEERIRASSPTPYALPVCRPTA